MVVKVSGRVSVKLEEDITFTFRKWNSEDLDNHSDCSLQVKFSRNRGEYLCLDKTWKHFGECNYFGAGNLVNDQKWPGRIHMKRDGAHGATVAGSYGPSVADGA